MSPIRTLEYILQLILVVGFGYLTYLNGFYWSYTAGSVAVNSHGPSIH